MGRYPLGARRCRIWNKWEGRGLSSWGSHRQAFDLSAISALFLDRSPRRRVLGYPPDSRVRLTQHDLRRNKLSAGFHLNAVDPPQAP